ncbi:MAG: gas vesicle protein K [Planctomycetota bacterium]|nr:gas vesicle protein K [Planctomycetota bacterium]
MPSTMIEAKVGDALNRPAGGLTGEPGAPLEAAGSASQAPRLVLDQGKAAKGLSQLAMTLIKLVHELLERQAIHRMEAGTLSEEEVERVGTALMLQAEEIRRLCEAFELDESELHLDLGPLGRLV